MNIELRVQLQKDLKIEQYKGEPAANYESRLVYSAMAEWMRVMIFDETTDDYAQKSKNYLLRQGRSVLQSFIANSKELQTWFSQPNGEECEIDDAVKEIRNRMVTIGEYIELFPSHDLSLPLAQRISASVSHDRIIGAWNYEASFKHVGLTRVAEASDVYEKHIWKIGKFMHWIQKNARWNAIANIEKYEFFNPHSTEPPYKSWRSIPARNADLQLARLSLINGKQEYYLFHREGDDWVNAVLPQSLSERKEERRIVLGLRTMNNNPAVAKFKCKGEVGILQLFCRLPLFEETYIETYSWPLKSYKDKLNYIVPMEIWSELKELLQEQLGMIIEE